MQLVPDGVVNATSSPSSVLTPPRNATRNSALSTGPAASTHRIASAIGAPASGAGDPESGAVDDVCAEPVVVADGDPAARDGVIGVSWAPRCSVPDSAEHPASSTDAASNTEIRMRPG